MTPQLMSPEDHEPGTVSYHLASAEQWLQMAHDVSGDEHYNDGEDRVTVDWSLQHLHATELAVMASAHAAIAQAKLAAGRPVE